MHMNAERESLINWFELSLARPAINRGVKYCKQQICFLVEEIWCKALKSRFWSRKKTLKHAKQSPCRHPVENKCRRSHSSFDNEHVGTFQKQKNLGKRKINVKVMY